MLCGSADSDSGRETVTVSAIWLGPAAGSIKERLPDLFLLWTGVCFFGRLSFARQMSGSYMTPCSGKDPVVRQVFLYSVSFRPFFIC